MVCEARTRSFGENDGSVQKAAKSLTETIYRNKMYDTIAMM